jgi:SRSO17 transposase
MEDTRNYANIERRLTGGDGQGLQQFMTDSPWLGQKVFRQIQIDIIEEPALRQGGILILDESADAKAGRHSIGTARQRNGRLGKVDMCQVATNLAFYHPTTRVWTLVDGELFIPEVWFTKANADLRKEVGLPSGRVFETKPQLGLKMIQRVREQGLPFERVACDDLYGRGRGFRAALDSDGIRYAAEVPSDTQVYLQPPKVGVPRKRRRSGRTPTRRRVLSRHRPREVRALARSRYTEWRRVQVRHTERGVLEADFAVRQVWTLTKDVQVRAEWLVIRRDLDGRLTFVLLNDPPDTPAEVLIQASCHRYFVERTYQDAKSELGWNDFQARKYRAWEHHMALTAAALWFVAGVKLGWQQTYARDPELLRQLEIEVLPALSTANVRDLLQATLPLPQLTPQQARELVVTHLVHRARSTGSRLKHQRDYQDSS